MTLKPLSAAERRLLFIPLLRDAVAASPLGAALVLSEQQKLLFQRFDIRDFGQFLEELLTGHHHFDALRDFYTKRLEASRAAEGTDADERGTRPLDEVSPPPLESGTP